MAQPWCGICGGFLTVRIEFRAGSELDQSELVLSFTAQPGIFTDRQRVTVALTISANYL